jgi:tetratricopeptide (TPR) repeat protein
MKVTLIAALCIAMGTLAQASQSRTASPTPPRAVAAQPGADKIAEAYDQFLLGRHYESEDNNDAAVAAYKRAMELDPTAADVPAELAGLYMRQNKGQEAMTAAEQAVKIEPANREANRVLGLVYAALAESRDSTARGRAAGPDENSVKAIRYLEIANDDQRDGESDPNVRATLSRLYLSNGSFDKAIPLLSALVTEEPQWHDGPLLLAEAYAGSGRARDGIAFLQDRAAGDPRLLPTLGELYERERRWKEAADVYEKAIQQSPRAPGDLRLRYASALLNAGGRDQITKARDVLAAIVTVAPTNPRALYLLSQAQRQSGDTATAETTARKLIAQSSKSPWGYYALAETLEERRDYQAVVAALAPAVAAFEPRASGEPSVEAGLLLPHLGFAYQQLGQLDKAIASFETARRLAPGDPSIAAYLAEANVAAKKYQPAAEIARAAFIEHPDDLRLARIQALALRLDGKTDQAVAVLEDVLKQHGDNAVAYVALAGVYSEAGRGDDAVKVLKNGQAKFAGDNAIAFELGAVLDKQKRYADAEAVFKQVLARDPDNAAALNYLGYMLAERGERLDESVGLLQQALKIEPDNGSFLDSLGWAYYKADKLDLAESNLRRAADQLKLNSVIQDHYGDVLSKLGRVTDAIAAWTRALAGDGDSIDRADIDRKIRTAKQKTTKK